MVVNPLKKQWAAKMRTTVLPLILCLSACAGAPPDDTDRQGVGFGDPEEFARSQNIEQSVLGETPLPDGPNISDERPNTEVADTDNPSISDEQDFEAVSARETIESDAERIARQQEAFIEIEPEDLPSRPSNTGPNIVEFALSTSHPVGSQQYRRGSTSERRFERACGEYSSADQAQLDFLNSGGPERDRKGVDPDGDGYACDWNPAPFRAARSG